jgi:hypothetical protein
VTHFHAQNDTAFIAVALNRLEAQIRAQEAEISRVKYRKLVSSAFPILACWLSLQIAAAGPQTLQVTRVNAQSSEAERQDAMRSPSLRLQQFIEEPSLTAQQGQVVILDGPATDANGATIRYRLQAGRHEFCLQGNQPYFSGIVLENAFGQEVLRNESRLKCVKADVPAGFSWLIL